MTFVSIQQKSRLLDRARSKNSVLWQARTDRKPEKEAQTAERMLMEGGVGVCGGGGGGLPFKVSPDQLAFSDLAGTNMTFNTGRTSSCVEPGPHTSSIQLPSCLKKLNTV